MMRVLAWNVGPRPWREILRSLGQLMGEHEARVTGLFEASNPLLVAALRVRYPGHRVICRRSDVVALVPRRVARPRVNVIGHDVAWRGPKLGNAKAGRRWLMLSWDDETILLVHRVTPIGNVNAWDAETELLREVAKRWDIERLAIIGDHNGTHDRLRPQYARLGLSLLPVHAKVDHCAVRDFLGGGTRLGNYDSDHVAILWRLR
jgi:hypothetical protein